MLPRLDGRGQMLGAKTGGRGQEHDVHITLEELLIGVQADETAVRRDFHPIGQLTIGLQGTKALLERLGKGVGHGDKLAVRIGNQGVGSSSGASTSAADQADLQ